MCGGDFGFRGYYSFDEGKALNTFKNYFYAIRDPVLAAYNLNIFDTREIQNLFAGAFQKKPPKRGSSLMPKWLLGDLLSMLSNPPFEPLELADLDHVLVKTVTLSLLATGRRMVEIAAMIPDCSPVEKNSINFQWFPSFIAKAERWCDGWVPVAPEIKSISTEDSNLCPVRCFRIYFARRAEKVLQADFGGRMWPVGKIKLLSSNRKY